MSNDFADIHLNLADATKAVLSIPVRLLACATKALTSSLNWVTQIPARITVSRVSEPL
jgi:hypothetical protein